MYYNADENDREKLESKELFFFTQFHPNGMIRVLKPFDVRPDP
jgi:hypothetical protein